MSSCVSAYYSAMKERVELVCLVVLAFVLGMLIRWPFSSDSTGAGEQAVEEASQVADSSDADSAGVEVPTRVVFLADSKADDPDDQAGLRVDSVQVEDQHDPAAEGVVSGTRTDRRVLRSTQASSGRGSDSGAGSGAGLLVDRDANWLTPAGVKLVYLEILLSSTNDWVKTGTEPLGSSGKVSDIYRHKTEPITMWKFRDWAMPWRLREDQGFDCSITPRRPDGEDGWGVSTVVLHRVTPEIKSLLISPTDPTDLQFVFGWGDNQEESGAAASAPAE